MAKQNGIKFNLDGMDELIKSLNDGYFIRVGIIGSKATATHDQKSGKTTAQIGSYHEFGSEKVKGHPPRRSFLEDSLKFKIDFNTQQMQAIKKDMFKYVFEEKNPKKFLASLGAECLRAIKEAFETNGFGKWKPLASLKTVEKRYEKSIKGYERVRRAMERGKMEYNKGLLDKYLEEALNPQILTDTGKLRKSISFKIMKRKG